MFDAPSARYLRDVSAEDWKGINPDIFGSMIQSVANAELRSELGMHYTSVPNIMKVLGPLFLDELDAEIDKAWDRERPLRQVLDRISKIRVFDPACGSGNFLVVAYRALREREITILSRLSELTGGAQTEMWSVIPIRNFYGIELTDFAVETAKLALFIAEYQANARFKEAFGRKPADLPLRDAANVICDNALRVNWERVCPVPEDGGEVFIAGNPPFLGKAQQDADQKQDKDIVFGVVTSKYKAFDYVVGWFYKAGQYIKGRNARAALVSTNSVVQGDAVSTIWPLVLGTGREIFFAHRTFKWRNNASANAAVTCVIVGIRNRCVAPKTLIDGEISFTAANINAYLLDAPDLAVTRQSFSLFGLPDMQFGNMAYDAGNLLMTRGEREQLLDDHPEAAAFVRRFVGSQELIKGIDRFCLWIDDDRLEEAIAIPGIVQKIEATRLARLDMKDASGRALAERPHQFREHYAPVQNAYLVPRVSSERREFLPVDRVGVDTISSDLNQVLYDAPDWCMALIASRLHLVWIGTVCGRLESRFRYSSTLGWNTFPVPKFTEDQLSALTKSAMAILRCRLTHHPKTIADLYDPEKMPDDLRAAHKANDDLLESMYIGRAFRNDTERLEHLFKLYAARVKKLKKGAA
jgi:SAM-dependent methyltransferase